MTTLLELHVVKDGRHQVIAVEPGARVVLEGGEGEEHRVWRTFPGAESIEVVFRGDAPMMLLKTRETAERGAR